MKIEIIHTQSEHYSKFTRFVEGHQLLFTSQAWKGNYPAKQLVTCAIFNKNQDVIGSFVYFTFKKFFFNCVITPPYAPHIDLFYINPAESVVGKNSFTKDILSLLADYFKQLKADYLNINLPETIVDSQPFIWNAFVSKSRYTYLIDLEVSKVSLWDNLSSEKRKSLNKAQKDNLEIKESNDYQLIYDLILQSLQRNEVAKNLSILKHILFNFANTSNSFAFVAYENNKAIAASFCLIYKTKAVYLFGGFDTSNKHHGAGVSCMWQSILKAKEMELQYFDFEGSMNTAIERYFREFGGELRSYVCVEHIRPLMNVLLSVKNKKPV